MVNSRTLLCLAAAGALAAGDSDPLPFPGMAPAVGNILAKDYYDKARFRPRLMVERALRALEQTEIGIDTLWADGRIVLNIRGVRSAIDAADPADMPAAMALIEAVREAVEKGFDAPPQQLRRLAYTQLNGALATLDPHTVMWPPDEAREWAEDNIQGQFYGIGAFLNQEEGLISIQRVMPGLPAERAGVEDGDVILSIDGEKTGGLTLDQAVRRIKGPKGTTVTLGLERKGAAAPVEVPIVRDLVKVVTIRHHRDGDVGYVRMDEFNANTAHDLFIALRELEKDSPIKALVLDLRFNGGGLLDQAKLIGGFFLGRGQEVVRTTSVDGQEDAYRTKARRFVTAPMLVLTSPGTASAAEIVSGALQLNERAVVAGETTFGKGSVQNIRELRDASRLKLTIQEYLLPGGVSIQDVGVQPDLALVRHAMREDGTVDLREMTSERERDREFALGSRQNYRHEVVAELGWLDPWLDREARRAQVISAREFRPDRQGQLAVDLLKAAAASPDWDAEAAKAGEAERLRPFLIERLGAPIAARAEAESAALAAALARLPRPITWGGSAAPDPGSLSIAWTGPAAVAAGETVPLSVSVRNAGAAEAGRLFAVIKADPRSPFWEEEFVVGAVPAGGESQGLLTFPIPPRLPSGSERFTIELFQDGRSGVLASCQVELAITPRPAPAFAASWRIADQDGDGILALDERAELILEVRNTGTAAADAGAVWVEKDNNPYVSLGASRLIFPAVPAGGSTQLSFPLTVRKEAKRAGVPVPMTADRVKLNLAVAETLPDGVDARFRAELRASIEVPVGQPHRVRQLDPPTVTRAEATPDGGRTRLLIEIADRSAGESHPLEVVALYQDEDKVDLQPASALDGPAAGGPWVYTPRITLKPGLNQLRVVVRDADGILAVRGLRLWGPEAVAGATP
jgi:carboxyl-terminal processing protease